MATWTKFYQHIENLHKKVHDMSADTLKAILTSDIPLVTDSVLADVTPIAATGGYAALTLTSVTVEQTSGILPFLCADISWTPSGADFAAARAIVIYNDTPTSPADPLIAFLLFETAIIIPNGETFTRSVNETTGIYYGQ